MKRPQRCAVRIGLGGIVGISVSGSLLQATSLPFDR